MLSVRMKIDKWDIALYVCNCIYLVVAPVGWLSNGWVRLIRRRCIDMTYNNTLEAVSNKHLNIRFYYLNGYRYTYRHQSYQASKSVCEGQCKMYH